MIAIDKPTPRKTKKAKRTTKTRLTNTYTVVTGVLVGKDYQADIPELLSNSEKLADETPEDMLIWSPAPETSDAKVDEYIATATKKFGYKADQALGMLQWHKHSIKMAIADLPNYQPNVEEWSVKDKSLFEKAFQTHGKDFGLIALYFPGTKLSKLVDYYYTWKKTRDWEIVEHKRQFKKS